MRKSAELRLTLTADIHKIYLQGEKLRETAARKKLFYGVVLFEQSVIFIISFDRDVKSFCRISRVN